MRSLHGTSRETRCTAAYWLSRLVRPWRKSGRWVPSGRQSATHLVPVDHQHRWGQPTGGGHNLDLGSSPTGRTRLGLATKPALSLTGTFRRLRLCGAKAHERLVAATRWLGALLAASPRMQSDNRAVGALCAPDLGFPANSAPDHIPDVGTKRLQAPASGPKLPLGARTPSISPPLAARGPCCRLDPGRHILVAVVVHPVVGAVDLVKRHIPAIAWD